MFAAQQFDNWSVASPGFGFASFDPFTGNFTVPVTGLYQFNVTVRQSLPGSLTISLGPDIDPAIVLRRTSPVVTELAYGYLPILDVDILLGASMRAILDNGTTSFSQLVELNAGDVVGLFYEADGLTIAIEFEAEWSGAHLEEAALP